MELRIIDNVECENISQNITEEHIKIMTEGYAATTKDNGDITWLVFQEVDDHIDGNGYASLLMIEGEGIFYYKEEQYSVKKGNVMIFSDKQEHGFMSETVCQAINIVWESEPKNDDVIEIYKAIIKINQKNKNKIKPI